MSGDNLGCHRGSTLIFSGGGGGGGGQGYQSTPQSPGQIPLQSTVGCHTDSEDFTYPAGARFLLCRLQGTRELGGDPVSQPAKCSLFGVPLLGTAYTECSAIRNKASFFPAGEVWTQPMKTPRSRVTRVQRWPFLHTCRQARHGRPGLISFLSLSSVSQGLPQVNFLLSG